MKECLTKKYFESRRLELEETYNRVKQDWQELAEYFLPRSVRFLARNVNKTSLKNKKIKDSTTLRAVRDFSSGMMTGATNVMVRKGMQEKEAKKKAQEMTLDERVNYVADNFDDLVPLAKNVRFAGAKTEMNKLDLTPEQQRKRVEIQDKAFQQFVQAGVDEESAFNASRLISDRAIVNETRYGIDSAEWYNNLGLKIENQGQMKRELALNQSANIAGAGENETEEAKKEYKEKGTESQYFKKWFRDSKVVDEEGNVKSVYRGDVVTIDTFDNEKASPEGDMGAGFYFSDNETDVDDNYYNGGPDFDNKVARRAEQIQQEREEEGEDIDYDEAKELAEKEMRGTPEKLEVYLSIQNPVYVGSNETYLLSDISDEMAEINEEDYESYEEYEQVLQEAKEEALQNISYSIDDELGGLLSYDDIEKAKGILFEYFYEGGVTLQKLKNRLNEEYFEDENGNIVANEVARRIAAALGYDGIIDDSVSNKFKNMGIPSGTTHYIAFYPEQIKSVENQGTFDAENPNIYLQSAYQEQNIVDLTDVFDKVPTFEEVEKHLKDILNNDIAFATKTSGYKIDIKQTNVKRNGKKPTNVVNKLTKKGNKTKSQSVIKRNNKYLSVIEKLISNSELKRNQEKNTDGYENVKKADKPHIKRYYNFDVPVLIGDIVYTVRLQTEEWIDDKVDNGIKTVHLYNIYENKKSPRLVQKDRLNSSTREDADSINQKQNNVKYQEPSTNSNVPRGQIELKKNEAIITLLQGADKSTIPHELAHLFLNDLKNTAMTNEVAREDLARVDAWLGHYGNSEYTVAQHEKFARGFEAYLMSGQAPNSRIKNVFDQFKDWLKQIYNSVESLGVELSPQAMEIYDNLFANHKTDDEIINQYIEDAKKRSEKSGLKTSEFQKEYKEAAYQILAFATGKNIKYLKSILENPTGKRNAKKVENFEKLLSEAKSGDIFARNKDAFTGSGWSDFFNVDIEDTSATEEIIEQAYDVIMNKHYLKNSIAEYEFELNEADVQYKFLMKKYQNSKGQEKFNH